MTTEEFIRAWIEQVWNQRDASFIHRHMANPCPVKGLVGEVSTPDEFEQFHRVLLARVDDLSIEILNCLTHGEEGAAFCQLTGKDSRTQNDVEFLFSFHITVRDDQVIEGTNIVDSLTFLNQLGELPGDCLERALA